MLAPSSSGPAGGGLLLYVTNVPAWPGRLAINAWATMHCTTRYQTRVASHMPTRINNEGLDPSASGFGGKLSAGSHAQLGEDVFEVRLHRPFGDEEALADLGAGKPFCHQTHHLELAGGEARPARGGPLALAAPAGGVGDRLVERHRAPFLPGAPELLLR